MKKNIILALSLLSYFIGSGQQNFSNWQIFVGHLYKDHKIKVYFNSQDLLNKDFRIQFDTKDKERTLKAALYALDLDLLEYNNSQWVVIKSEDAHKSFQNILTLENLEVQKQVSKNAIPPKSIGEPNKISNDTTVKVFGKIIEESSLLPSIGTTIETSDKNKGTATDATGYYELKLPIGRNQFTIRSMGMNTEVIDVIIYESGELNIKLQENAISLEEIIIKERATDENIKKVVAGVEQLSMKEIKKLPSFMGETDVFKSLLTLPGVRSAGEGVGGLNVRGGNTDQNLILQDNILFFNPTHALGFFSLFQPDLVEGVKLFKGNIPAKFGGRLSSVLQTNSVTGDKSEWKINGGIGAVSSKIAFQGPLIKDRLSIAAGSRLSTINWILKQVQVPDVQSSKVNFYDMQGKLNFWINTNSTLGIQAYNADDKIKLANDAKFGYKTFALSGYYQTIFNRNKNLNVRLVSGNYSSILDDLLPANSSLFKTGVNYISAKTDLTIDIDDKKYFNAGIEAIRYSINPGNILPGVKNSEVKPKIAPQEKSIEAGLFGEVQLPITKYMIISAGIRISFYSLIGPAILREYNTTQYFNANALSNTATLSSGELYKPFIRPEPRISANYEINKSSSIKLSYSRNYQYLAQISNTVAPTPIDFWKLADNNLKPQSSHNYSIGYFKNFENNTWETSLEVYYRSINNTIDYRDFADLLANEAIEQELLLGKGKNYGVELSIKKTIGKVTNRIGYTFARTLKQINFKDEPRLSINQGNWYPSNYDKPHEFNLLFNYNTSQRYSLNLNYNYSTGRAITGPNGRYDDFNIIGVPIFSNRNNFRLPDFHRLDASFNIFPGYRRDKKWKGSWTLGLYNLMARKNAYSVNFKGQSINRLRAYQLSVLGTVLPFITYNFQIQ